MFGFLYSIFFVLFGLQKAVHKNPNTAELETSAYLCPALKEDEGKSDEPSAGTSANHQSDDVELNMLVPEVKIRLAKERPFREVCLSLK